MRFKHVSLRFSFLAFFILALSFLAVRSRLAALLGHFSPSRPLATQSRFVTMAYEKELKVAQLAVQRAAILTKAVFHEKAKGTVSKDVSENDR